MELIMGGLLMGASGMLVLLVVALWKETASHQAETHPPHRGL
jgi:hypothetical protein